MLHVSKTICENCNENINCIVKNNSISYSKSNMQSIQKFISDSSVFLTLTQPVFSDNFIFSQNYWVYSQHNFNETTGSVKQNIPKKHLSLDVQTRANKNENITANKKHIIEGEKTENIPQEKHSSIFTNLFKKFGIKKKRSVLPREDHTSTVEENKQNPLNKILYKQDNLEFQDLYDRSTASHSKKLPVLHIPPGYQRPKSDKKKTKSEKVTFDQNVIKYKETIKTTEKPSKPAVKKVIKPLKRKQGIPPPVDVYKKQPDKTHPADINKDKIQKRIKSGKQKDKVDKTKQKDEMDADDINKRQKSPGDSEEARKDKVIKTHKKQKSSSVSTLVQNDPENIKTRKVHFVFPETDTKHTIDPKFLQHYDADFVKKHCHSQIEHLRNDDMYTDSEFDELDDEIYEIILSYGQKKRKTGSETSLDCASLSSYVLGERGLLKEILGAFRRQKAHVSTLSVVESQLKTVQVKIQYGMGHSDYEGLNLPSSYNISLEDVESTLLRDFSPERESMSEDRCFKLFTTPEPGEQITIPNAFYSIQEFINTCGFDPEGPLITDQIVHSKFQTCLDVAKMYSETLTKRRVELLIHLAMTAPQSVQGHLRQLAESIINRRINSEDEINGYLNRIHAMAVEVNSSLKNDISKKAVLDNFRLIAWLKKKIFSEFYRKVAFYELRNGEDEVLSRHLYLLHVIPKLYKTGFFPFIDLIAEYIANDKVTTPDQLEVALNRFLVCSDGQITDKEFSDWCTFFDNEVTKDKTKF